MVEHIDEKALKHPAEEWIFAGSVLLNVGLLVLALYVATTAPTWLEGRPIIAKYLKQIQALATGMALAPFALTFARNARRSYLRGNAVALSRQQMPDVYALLERLCARIGIEEVPVLFLADTGVSGVSTAFRARRKDFIALSSKLFEPKFSNIREVLNFTIARELGSIRFGYTKWLDELLVAYVVRIPYLRDPLEKIRIMSLDRYAASLVPDGLPGLIALASSRLMVHNVNVADYLAQLEAYRDRPVWRWIAQIGKKDVPVMLRANALYKAGFFNREADLRHFTGRTPIKGWDIEVPAVNPQVFVEPAVTISAPA